MRSSLTSNRVVLSLAAWALLGLTKQAQAGDEVNLNRAGFRRLNLSVWEQYFGYSLEDWVPNKTYLIHRDIGGETLVLDGWDSRVGHVPGQVTLTSVARTVPPAWPAFISEYADALRERGFVFGEVSLVSGEIACEPIVALAFTLDVTNPKTGQPVRLKAFVPLQGFASPAGAANARAVLAANARFALESDLMADCPVKGAVHEGEGEIILDLEFLMPAFRRQLCPVSVIGIGSAIGMGLMLGGPPM